MAVSGRHAFPSYFLPTPILNCSNSSKTPAIVASSPITQTGIDSPNIMLIPKTRRKTARNTRDMIRRLPSPEELRNGVLPDGGACPPEWNLSGAQTRRARRKGAIGRVRSV